MINKNILIALPVDVVGGAEMFLKMIAEQLAFGNNIHVITQRKRNLGLFEFGNNKIFYCSEGRIHWFIYFIRNICRIRKTRFDYAFTSASHVNSLIGFFRRLKILNIKYVVARESTSMFTRREEFNMFKEKCYYHLGYSAIDLLICQTGYMKIQLLENLPWMEKKINIQVIPNPVNLNDMLEKAKEKTKMPTGKPFIVAAGRFHAVKGFDILVKAFSTLKSSREDFKLIILGQKNDTEANGNLGDKIESLIRELNLEEDVILYGLADNVYPFFKNARMCVVSSRIEGFPNVLLQMMSQNEKVVSTLCAGDIDKIDGLFTCRPNDEQDLLRAMQQCLEVDTAGYRTLFDKELRGRSVDGFMDKIMFYLK
jgi:glycosyltransferase involved in cell wall biosynthesis